MSSVTHKTSNKMSQSSRHMAMGAFFDSQFNHLNKMSVDAMNKVNPGSGAVARQPSYIPRTNSSAPTNKNQRRTSSNNYIPSSTSSRPASAGATPRSARHHRENTATALVFSPNNVASNNERRRSESHQRPQSAQPVQHQQRRAPSGSRRNSSTSITLQVPNNSFLDPQQQQMNYLEASPATMFPPSRSGMQRKLVGSNISKKQQQQVSRNVFADHQQHESSNISSSLHQNQNQNKRARSPFFVESDIHSGKTFKRVPSPEFSRCSSPPASPIVGTNTQKPTNNQSGMISVKDSEGNNNITQHQQQHFSSSVARSQPQPAITDEYNDNNNDDHQEQQHQHAINHDRHSVPQTARTTHSFDSTLLGDNSSILQHDHEHHSFQRSASATGLRNKRVQKPPEQHSIEQLFVPKTYAHVHNPREENESKIARCLRSGYNFRDEEPQRQLPLHFRRSASSPTFNNNIITSRQTQNQNQEITTPTMKNPSQPQSGRNSPPINLERSLSAHSSARERSNSRALPPQGSIMQCFLEDPPAPTFSVAGGRKTRRSQLNFIVHTSPSSAKRNNNNNSLSNSNILSMETSQTLATGGAHSLLHGEGKSRVFVAAVDDDHVAVAISPRENNDNNKNNKGQTKPGDAVDQDRDSPPSTILSSPRYDRIDPEELFSSDFMHDMRKINNQHHNNNNTHEGGSHVSFNDQSVLELFTNHRELLDAAEVVIRFSANDFCDMYRHVFCSKDAERFTVPCHHAPSRQQQQHNHHQTVIYSSNNGQQQRVITSNPETDVVLSPLHDSDDKSLSENMSPVMAKTVSSTGNTTTTAFDNNVNNKNDEHQQLQQRNLHNNIASPLLSDFPSSRRQNPNDDMTPVAITATEKRHRRDVNYNTTSVINPFQRRAAEKTHGFAVVHPYPSPTAEDKAAVNAHQHLALQHQDQKKGGGGRSQSQQQVYYSPILHRLKELNNISSPHRYSVMTAAWCALWCTSVALDLPCISAYRKYTHDIVLPRRPTLRELQSEFFGGVAVSDASSRWNRAHPKECTIASKVLGATKELGMDLVLFEMTKQKKENLKNGNRNGASATMIHQEPDRKPLFTRSHIVRLDSALQHSMRWLMEVATFEEEEENWKRELQSDNNNDNDNIPVGQDETETSFTLDGALDRLQVRDSSDLHCLLIAKALLKWSWELRESAVGMLEIA